MIQSSCARLHDNLEAAGIPVVTVRQTGVSSFEVQFGENATDEHRQQAAAIVAAFDPAPTEADRLDAAPLRGRVLAALVLRASSGWSSLSAARRNRVQALIDNAAADIAATLS